MSRTPSQSLDACEATAQAQSRFGELALDTWQLPARWGVRAS